MHGQNYPMKCCIIQIELAECMQAGYAVIFLHRRHSIQPFTKGLPSGQILDFMTSVLEPDEGAPGCHLLRMHPSVIQDYTVHL